VCSVLLGVVFCLDFDPFFFSSLVSLAGCYLFIYLSVSLPLLIHLFIFYKNVWGILSFSKNEPVGKGWV
jgi:hypothetical protein